MAVWGLTVDLKQIWKNEDLSFEQQRDEIVTTVRDSGWRTYTSRLFVLDTLLEELSEAEDIPEFDAVFSNLYDLADIERVWIATLF